MKNNYQILLEKLDAFIRKYYKNFVIRGIIYSSISVLALFMGMALIEYFAYLSSSIRAALFFSFIIFNAVVILRFIIIPFLKIYRLGKIISNEQAAQIIGTHFQEIGDKLLNVLQLKKLEDTHPLTRTLIEAGINQKIELIKPFHFRNAVNLKENRKYLRYLLPLLLIFCVLLLASPSVITDSAKRIVNYGTYFEKEAPFKFVIANTDMSCVQNEDFMLDIQVTGDEIPAEVYIESGTNRFLLQKISPSRHQYIFRNVQRDVSFNLYAAGYTSRPYQLKVLPKPIILNFYTRFTYPSYLNKKEEIIHNTGDMTIPTGTVVSWHFSTRDTRQINFMLNGVNKEMSHPNPDFFTYTSRFTENTTYSVSTQNEYVNSADSLSYSINIIPDAFPEIQLEEFRDSVFDNQLFFSGQIKDDYGFKKLTFNHAVLSDNSDKKTQTTAIQINNTINQQQFFHQFNINDLSYTPGDVIEYYFEVWDNDGVNGSKSTRSRTMLYKTLTKNELQEKTDNKSDQLKNDMQAALNQAKSIQKSIDELNKRMLEKKTLSWQDKQSIEQLLEKTKELEQKTEDIQKAFEEKEEWEKQYTDMNEEILKKQEELNKLLEKLMSDEMKKMFEELEKMLEKLDKDKVKDALDKIKLNTKDVEKELDRSLELYKQFEFEKKLSETIEKLDTLTKEQKELSEKTEQKESPSQESKEKQETLNKDFEDLKKDLDDLDKKNNQLEKPNNFERTDEMQDKISEEMTESMEQLQKNNSKKASQSQKNAASQMKELSDKLKQMEEDMLQQNLAEDIDALRDILENLLHSSFAQEELMLSLSKTRTNDPKYIALMQEQNKIKDDLKMTEDSLFALSKRQLQIQSFVNSEIADINDNLDKAIESLVARNIQYATSKQQYVMTHINNLALMLNESMQNMQMQMSQSGSCNKSCNKPGQGKPSFKSMRQMQEALNKMLQDMKDGKQPDGKSGGQSLSEQLARAAAQQEAIRNHLKALAEELKKEGMGNSKELDELQRKMEQTETDLVNKLLSRETIKRQQDILTRLLEHEKAEMEREMEEQRQSKEAKNQKYSNPEQFFKYNNIKLKEEELLKTVPPSFKIFYKNKINEYFYNFQE